MDCWEMEKVSKARKSVCAPGGSVLPWHPPLLLFFPVCCAVRSPTHLPCHDGLKSLRLSKIHCLPMSPM